MQIAHPRAASNSTPRTIPLGLIIFTLGRGHCGVARQRNFKVQTSGFLHSEIRALDVTHNLLQAARQKVFGNCFKRGPLYHHRSHEIWPSTDLRVAGPALPAKVLFLSCSKHLQYSCCC
jgi:hypothetical protein